MVHIVKLALVLGAAVASGRSLRKPVPDAADSAVAKKGKGDAAKTGKGSTSKAPPPLILTREDIVKKVTATARTGKGSTSNAPPRLILTREGREEMLNEATAKLKFGVNDFGAFWQGRDFPEERLPVRVLAPDDGVKAERNVHVFGLQDSGTSILKAYLYTNFGRKLNYFDGAFTTNKLPNQRKGLWTFANFKELNHLEHDKIQSLNEAEVRPISVLRNPFGWLQAVRTGSTAVWMECVQGDDWLTRPCSHHMPAGPASTIPNMTFESIAGIWSHWSDGFVNAEDHGFSRNLLVKYEDLILHPVNVLNRIANYLDLKKPASGWTIPFKEAPARAEAEKFVGSGAFLKQNFTEMEQQQACIHLDEDVVQTVGYKVFDCSEFTKLPAGHLPTMLPNLEGSEDWSD